MGELILRSAFIERVRHLPLEAAALAERRVSIESCRCASLSCQGWRLAPVEWKPVDLR